MFLLPIFFCLQQQQHDGGDDENSLEALCQQVQV